MPTTFTEQPDPMYGTAVCGMDVFYKKWGPNLDATTIDKWDWTELKKRLASKPSDEKWFVVKSVDTLPAEDESVPFIPNYICFAAPANGSQQAPRFCMKAATRSPTHDPEAFIPDDIVDMSTTHEWRPLKDDKSIFVLCGKYEKTDSLVVGFGTTGGFGERIKRKDHDEEAGELKRSKPDPEEPATFTFGGKSPDAPAAPAAPATGGFTFGGQAPTPAPATGGFTFGGQAPTTTPATGGFTFGGQTPTPAPATGGFTFGGQAPTTTPATGGFTFGGQAPTATTASSTGEFTFGAPAAPSAPASTSGSDFFSNTSALTDSLKHETSDEPVFPVFWQENTISDLREEIDSGAKIITQLSDPLTKERIKVVIENDLEFLEATEAKQAKSVTKILQKHVLRKSDAYKALLDKYQGDHIVEVPTAEEMERMTKEFSEKKKALIEGELAGEIATLSERCSKLVTELVMEIANERSAKNKQVLEQLTTINSDIEKGEMYSRDKVVIHRIFPEKNSMGDACAFRPSKQINKSAGRADVCYPEEYVLVNTLLLAAKKRKK